MGDEPGTVSAADEAVSREAFFFDKAGNPLPPEADGAVRGEIIEHLPGGRTRSTVFVIDDRSAA